MTLADEPTTAEMDPWLLVDVMGEDCLFGFAKRHPSTGGLSWTRSTPVVELDETARRARTESGRVYALGRRVAPAEGDKEGTLALRGLLPRWTAMEPPSGDDIRWATTMKMARHLAVEPPPRNAPAAIDEFLANYRHLHAARLAGRRDPN